jgi:hypothetical protein
MVSHSSVLSSHFLSLTLRQSSCRAKSGAGLISAHLVTHVNDRQAMSGSVQEPYR